MPRSAATEADDDGRAGETVPVLGHQGDWQRQDLLTIARDEMSNAIELRALVGEFPGQLVDTAPSADGEISLQFGPDLPEQLQRKADVMSDHWTDYDRLLTAPNL